MIYNSLSRNGSKKYQLFDLTNNLVFNISTFSLDFSYNNTAFSSNPSVFNTGGELIITSSDEKLIKYFLNWSKFIYDEQNGRQNLKVDYVRDLFILSNKIEESILLRNSFITSYSFDDIGNQEFTIKFDLVEYGSFPDSNLDDSYRKVKQIIRVQKINKIIN